jgi:hypothetical protein
MVTATSESAATAKSIESLTPVAPTAIVVELSPPKVTVRSVEESMVEPEVRRAMCTSLTVGGCDPKTFEIWMRAAVPPMLVCTM